MTSESIEKWINSSLSLITHKLFKDCVKVIDVDAKPLSEQIVIIVSDIFRVTMKLQFKDGTSEQLKAVFKMEPVTKQGFDQFVKDTAIFDVETMVYNKILRSMENLMLSKDKTIELLWPECYLCQDHKFLLQDLTEEGYRLVPTFEMLDVEHAVLAMKAIGKYHAMSLILKEQGIIEPEKLPANLLAKKMTFINILYSGAIYQMAEVMEQEWEEEWKPVAGKLRKAVENIGDKLKDLVTITQGKCCVVAHGDFTLRNILFKYDESANKTPINIRLLDFQGANWSNLGFDLITLLCGSLTPQAREENLDLFFETYSSSLCDCLTYYGYKGDLITASDVRQSYDSLGYFSTVVTLFAVPAFLGAKSDFVAEALENAPNQDMNEAVKNPFKKSYFRDETVQNAIKYQLKISLGKKLI